MDELRQRAIALYDAFTHGPGGARDRRGFLRDMTLLAGSAAAAEALIAAIAPAAAAAAIVPADDPRLVTRTDEWASAPGRTMRAYVARPAKGRPRAAIVVIHENRGLNDHIRDVARRVALDGFVAVAPDFLAPGGGTPADADQARTMIGQLDLARTLADAQSAIGHAAALVPGRKAGVTGFCWGGALVLRLAVAGAPGLKAAVSYYGPAPDPAEAERVAVPVMIHLPALDTRVAATVRPFAGALMRAARPLELHEYPGANHAFNNDSSAERYDAAAATLAWKRTIGFFRTHLG
ncbi:dienelactone hydrolase family protein [Sphingomonas changnyeongensis]|uniref:Dienelactone hydrolase family protein n=1 Tax=Sphingomonas changnyeongensis TaxID=2698679 RepID=A0A7Z2S4Y1_9SPHN|nr:dienelactone hydrolase family protein [Sphingomonas changnyeongensis]QHL90540.1 dienelactone hydrolase family protein [Sphingomonas changnyeongensis]